VEAAVKMMITPVGDINVVHLSGSLDSEASALVQQALQPIARTGGKIVLDMEKVDFVSSMHLAMLYRLYKNLAQTGGKLAMINVSAAIKYVLDASGFLQLNIISQFASEEDAIAAWSKTDSEEP
jgi:anti-anti-sigma factor